MTISILTEGLIGGGAADASPPTITTISPTPNTAPGAVGGMPADYATARTTPIVFKVEDSDGAANLVYVSVRAIFLNGTIEAVYGGAGNFVGEYVASSTKSSITNGIRLSVARTDGWPGQVPPAGNLAVGLAIDAVDAGGNVTSASYYWQMPLQVAVAPTPPPATAALPTATNFSDETLSLIVWQLRS